MEVWPYLLWDFDMTQGCGWPQGVLLLQVKLQVYSLQKQSESFPVAVVTLPPWSFLSPIPKNF